MSGAFTLGTRRTKYEIEIPKKRGGLLGALSSAFMPTAKVYEGEAAVQSPLFTGAVKEGEKLVSDGLAGNAIRRITPEDFLQAAEVYAELDVSQANVTNEQELEAAYLKLRGLHSDVLQSPGDQSKLMLLRRAQQEFGVPASDVGVPQQQPTDDPKPQSLNVNEKRVVPLTVTNGCKSVATWRLTVSNASFVRLVSPADILPSPGAEGEWKLEYDATGLQPGIYTGEIIVTCVDCANKQCLYAPRLFQVTLKVL